MNQPTINSTQLTNNAQKCYEFFSTKFTPELLYPNCPDREQYKAAVKECKEHFANVLKLTPQAVNVYMGLCKDIMTGKLTIPTEQDLENK